MANMAHDVDPTREYRPEMDGKTHETTYDGFVHFTTIGTMLVIGWVLSLAVGGVGGAWFWGIFGVIASTAAAALGGFVPAIGWRAPAAVLAFLLVIFLLTAAG